MAPCKHPILPILTVECAVLKNKHMKIKKKKKLFGRYILGNGQLVARLETFTDRQPSHSFTWDNFRLTRLWVVGGIWNTKRDPLPFNLLY